MDDLKISKNSNNDLIQNITHFIKKVESIKNTSNI